MSFLRQLEYQKLADLKLDGQIIDLGGMKSAGYHQFIQGDHVIKCANLDDGADYVINLEEKWDIADNSFDHAISLNTFEHLYDVHHALREAHRIIKPGGQLIFMVPFLFNVHYSPDDFGRYTASFWRRAASDHGYEPMEITPLAHGMLSSLFELKRGIYPSFVANILQSLCSFFDKTMCRHSARYQKNCGPDIFPLAYFVIFEKKK